MSYLEKIKKGTQHKPRKVLLYGVHGIGKSTWAAQWPNALFLDLERGLNDLDVASIDCHNSLDAFWGTVMELSSEHDLPVKTVVVDSLDWLERLVCEDVCEKANKASLSDIEFGKGKSRVVTIMTKILKALEQLSAKGYHLVLLAHCHTVKVEPPDEASYDRYQPKLLDGVSEIFQEWCDEVLFVKQKVFVKKEDEGFGRKRGVGIGAGERTIYTTETASHLAKNRLGLPPEIQFSADEFFKFVKG